MNVLLPQPIEAEAIALLEEAKCKIMVAPNPSPETVYPLLQLENVILTPHTAALTRECVTRMATEAARCVLEVFAGREPPNIANRDVLKKKRWRHLKLIRSLTR